MLTIPEIFYRYTWIGIDPGLASCGIAVFTAERDRIVRIDAVTLENRRLLQESELPLSIHGERPLAIGRLREAFHEILCLYQPVAVCCESPFYNPTRPSAFGSLTEIIASLRLTVYHYSSIIPFHLYAPQEVKQTFKRAGQLGKTVMLDALRENQELVPCLTSPLHLLDEHAIDAIAVGYTGWKALQPY